MAMTTAPARHLLTGGVTAVALVSLAAGCRRESSATATKDVLAEPRPVVIGPTEGERRFVRGGTAPLLIKADPASVSPWSKYA